MTTGTGKPIMIRCRDDFLGKVDAWAAQEGVSSRSQAIRQLVELGLTVRPSGQRSIKAENLNAENDG